MINNNTPSNIQTTKNNTLDARLLNVRATVEIASSDNITLDALSACGYPTWRFKQEGSLRANAEARPTWQKHVYGDPCSATDVWTN